MDCIVSIPKRVFKPIEKEKLTPLSVDVLISIPKRGYLLSFLPSALQAYQNHKCMTYLTCRISLKLKSLIFAIDKAKFDSSGGKVHMY